MGRNDGDMNSHSVGVLEDCHLVHLEGIDQE